MIRLELEAADHVGEPLRLTEHQTIRSRQPAGRDEGWPGRDDVRDLAKAGERP